MYRSSTLPDRDIQYNDHQLNTQAPSKRQNRPNLARSRCIVKWKYYRSLTSSLAHSLAELVGNPIHRISFFSFAMICIAIRTFSASYTLRRIFFWSNPWKRAQIQRVEDSSANEQFSAEETLIHITPWQFQAGNTQATSTSTTHIHNFCAQHVGRSGFPFQPSTSRTAKKLQKHCTVH